MQKKLAQPTDVTSTVNRARQSRALEMTIESFEAVARWRQSGPPAPAAQSTERVARKRGEQPITRQRASQRAIPGRAALVNYPGTERDVVALHARNLDVVRAWWHSFRDAKAALEVLRTALPLAVLQNKRTREAASEALRTVAQLLASTQAVHGNDDTCGSPEELWFRHAQHDLDDDDLARILSPAGHRRDRAKALAAVRARRSALR